MDWTKISAWAGIGCFVLALVSIGIQLSGAHPWVAVWLLVVALLGVTGLYGRFALSRISGMRSLPYRMLLSDCDFFLRQYRLLAFDYANEARLPLAQASLPDYGSIWQAHHVHMSSLKQQSFIFLYAAEMVFTEAGTAQDLIKRLGAGDSLVIVDLIANLEALRSELSRKSDLA